MRTTPRAEHAHTQPIHRAHWFTRQTTTPITQRPQPRDHFPHSDMSRDPAHRARIVGGVA